VPYFVRQPYAQLHAPHQKEPRSDEIDVLELAKDVLALESAESPERRFRIRDPLRPGGQGAMVLNLAPEKGAPTLTISLTASDLIGAGSRIASESVRISPSILTLPAGASAEVTVTVLAPPDARPGLYAGTVSATGDEAFSVPFQAEVR
jgi:hypothetical protein